MFGVGGGGWGGGKYCIFRSTLHQKHFHRYIFKTQFSFFMHQPILVVPNPPDQPTQNSLERWGDKFPRVEANKWAKYLGYE